MRDAIQIAGVIDQREADLLVGTGVDFLGFPLRLEDGREDLDESTARTIIASLPDGTSAVAITYLDRALDVLDLLAGIGARWVQLHGGIDIEEIAQLRALSPGLGIIKSLIVRRDNQSSLEVELARCAPFVDAFITDTHDPRTGRVGATGLVHDWRVSHMLVRQSPKPVILAGGLNPANVAGAILEVRPVAVDVHTGVEGADGRKDLERVRAFVSAARAAFARARHDRTDGA